MSSPGITNLRSCLTCKARKVKCDRRQPCSGCIRFGEECNFPQSPIRRRRVRVAAATGAGRGTTASCEPGFRSPSRSPTFGGSGPPSGPSPGCRAGSHSSNSNARLVVGEGGETRLLTENAWANVKSEEEGDFSRNLLKDADEEEGTPWSSLAGESAIGSADGTSAAWPGYWTPTPAQLELCWYIFVDNVDPVVRILHKPSAHKLVLEAQKKRFQDINPAPRVLLLTICFAAVQSLTRDRCETLFGQNPLQMQKMCQRSVELAFTQARLVRTHSLQVIQAFTLFLVCIRRDGSGAAWALVGLAMRIAMSLGIHRDGSDFGLSPFETEQRRRLWWELRLLDIRLSEDSGAVPSVFPNANTRLPLNVNDADLDPGADQPPLEQEGPTEMLYSLIRFEMCTALAEITNSDCNHDPLTPLLKMSAQDKERAWGRLNARIRRKYPYLFDGKLKSPFFRFAAETSKLVLVKVRLQLHFRSIQELERTQPQGNNGDFARGGDSDSNDERVPQGLFDDLFRSSVELLETCARLAQDDDMTRWCWLVHYYTQWHAVSFVLILLGRRIDRLVATGTPFPVPLVSLPDSMRQAWDVIGLVFRQRGALDTGGRMRVGSSTSEIAGGPWGFLECLRQRVSKKLDFEELETPLLAGGENLVPWMDLGMPGLNEDWPVALGTQISFGPGEDLSFLWGSPPFNLGPGNL